MTARITEVDDIRLDLEEGDVWACLGSRDRPVPDLAGDVARAISLAREVCAPKAVHKRLRVREVRARQVLLEGGLVLEGKFLAHCFEGAAEAMLLVVTVGPEIEARAADLFARGDDVGGFVMDAAGSAAVMNTFTQISNRIVESALRRGWQTGMCLRPGQSYWDITGQRSIFQEVPAERIGVRLLDSCFMSPQKSQSAVVPLGPGLKVHSDPDESYCRYCQAVRCPMRTEPAV